MRTVLISLVLATSTLSACSLYFDDSSEHKGKLGGVPDAGLDHDGGGAGSDCSDGGVDGPPGWPDGGILDGGGWHPDGGTWHPDGGAQDAGGAPDAYAQDAGGAPDAH